MNTKGELNYCECNQKENTNYDMHKHTFVHQEYIKYKYNNDKLKDELTKNGTKNIEDKYVTCYCGSYFYKTYYKTHLESKKHIYYDKVNYETPNETNENQPAR